MQEIITALGRKVVEGRQLDMDEALSLLKVEKPDFMDLVAWANRIRLHFKGDMVDTCSLLNAKSGRCSEDCAFCAQSGHYPTKAETYPLVSIEEMVNTAKKAEKEGVSRFCLITSGRKPDKEEFNKILSAVRKIRKETGLNLDCSLGSLTQKQVNLLKEAGVTRYNHNLECAESYYNKIVTTHKYSDRLTTIEYLQKAGLSVCCGGIIGMGETPEQRIEFGFKLRELEIDCVPINILNPRPGTPLEKNDPLLPLEIIKTIAIYRFILPQSTIKVAGGREVNLRDFQSLAFLSGANGLITGGYLTTTGRTPEMDRHMIKDLGLTDN
ncbi:MAG: biotin synthase BioB [Thermodesulfobacteriota bacterium]|nr:biotin synthase BioB [Thermodesulfobacteriota bacterium]